MTSGFGVRWELQFMQLRAANPQSISPLPSGESTLSPEATFSTRGSSSYRVSCLLDVAAMGGVTYGGVGAGPRLAGAPSGAILPPRASFLGVRSLSLVLADFGTLFLFLLFILIFSFLFCSSVQSLQLLDYQDSCQVSKMSGELRNCPLFSVKKQALMRGFLA